MGIFDNIKNKADELKNKDGDRTEDLPDQVRDRMGDGAERAGDMADNATGGRFSDQIDQGVDIARQRLGDADEPAQQQQEQ